jgi:tetratricopeptide (TPR) repeat protein/DNA-binding CsgD family transcriptional regulator
MNNFLLVFAGLLVIPFISRSQLQEFEIKEVNLIDQINQLNKTASEVYDSVPEMSFKLANMAMNLAREQNFDAGVAEAHLNLGNYYKLKLLQSKRLDNYSSALAIFKNLNDTINLALTYKLIGSVYASEGLIDKMLDNLNESIALYSQLNDSDGIYSCYLEMGNGYYWAKDYSNSTKYYLLSLSSLEGVNDSQNRLAGIFNNLGVNHLEQGNYSKALDYFRQSYSIYYGTNNLRRLTANYYNSARALIGMAEYDSAMTFAIKSHELSLNLKIDAALVESTQLLAELFEEARNYQEAYKYQKMHSQLVDSIRNVETARVIDNYASALEIEEAKLLIEVARKEHLITKIYRNLAAVGFFLVVLFSITGFLIWRGRHHKKMANFDAQKKLVEAEVENLSLRKKLINDELEFKNREVTVYSMKAVQKNTFLKEIRTIVDQIVEENQQETPNLRKLLNLIDSNSTTDKGWDEFKKSFEKVHQDFFSRIKEKHPDVTSKELEHCALIKLNRNLKETASVMGITSESVKMARHRLKKKLNLGPEESLVDYLIKF